MLLLILALTALAATGGNDAEASTRADRSAPALREAAAPAPREAAASPARAAFGAARGPADAPFTRVLQLRSAAFDAHPDVLVHAPAGFDPRGPVHVVMFLHGWNGCVRALSEARAPCQPGEAPRRGLDLIRRFDRANVSALFVVPQLAYLRRSSASGRLSEPAGLRALFAEMLAHPDLAPVLGGPRRIDELGRVVVFAHSGGYGPAARVLERGGVDVHELHFFDALYEMDPAFTAWGVSHAADFARDGTRRLTSFYTPHERTGYPSRLLVSRITRAMPAAARPGAVRHHADDRAPPPGTYEHPLLTVRTRAAHALVPCEYFTDLVRTARLPRARPPVGAVSDSRQ